MNKGFKQLILSALLIFGLKSYAQVSAYAFTQLSGTYNSIPVTGPSATNVAFGTQDDNVYSNIPIGFNFNFNGTTYTNVAINVNGWMSFGNNSPFSSYTPISSGTASNVVSFFGADLQLGPAQSCTTTAGSNVIAFTYTNASTYFLVGDTIMGTGIPTNATVTAISANNMTISASATAAGTSVYTKGHISYQVTGVTPNRIFTIQWRRFGRWSNTGTGLNDNNNAQIKLYETTNVIEVVYGKWGTFNSNNTNGEVGLRGLTNADFNNRSVASGGNYATSTAGASNNVTAAFNASTSPLSGQIYRWTPPPICAGAPASNTAVSNYTAPICSGGSVNLSLVNTYTSSGLTYQWFSSTTGAGGPYTAIPSATTPAYSPTNITVTTWYRPVITCTAGPASTTATPVQVQIATTTTNNVPYFEGFEGIVNNNDLPNCSWSASNLPSICKTYTAATGSWNQMPKSGSKYASFRWFTDPNGDYFYTNGIQLNAGTTYSASVYFITDGLQGWSEFSLLYGTSQSTTGLTYIASATGSLTNTTYSMIANTFTVPTSGIYYIAIKCIGNSIPWYLSWDDLSVIAPPACSGAPASNTAVASSSLICSGNNVGLSLANSYTVAGLSYQWAAATSSVGPYTAIPGGTLSSVTASNVTSGTWYNCVVTCGNGPASSTATSVFVGLTPPNTYATVPFLETFDNQWQNRCDLRNVPTTANWSSNPTTGDNSWRRQDDGASANWTSTTNTVTPLGAGSANFHTWDAPSGSTGDLSLYVNMGSTNNYSLSFYMQNTSGTDSLEVFLSTNGGNTFNKISNNLGVYNNWTKLTYSLGAVNSSSCVIKFTATSDYGADDLGIDSVRIFSSCVAPTLTLTASNNTICAGSSATLNVAGSSTYTWSTGSNSTSIVVSPTATTVYSVSGGVSGCTGNASSTLTVKPAPALVATANQGTIAATTISVCPSSVVTVTASGGSTYSWTPNGSTAASFTVAPSISAVYSVVATGTNGCTSSAVVNVLVIVCNGINNLAKEEANVILYPNPTDGKFTVSLTSAIENGYIELFDVTGKLILSQKLNSLQNEISTKEISKGVYNFRVSNGKEILKQGKLIKQ